MKNIFDTTLKMRHMFYLIFVVFIVSVIIFFLKCEFRATDIIIAFSTLVAPLVALQIQTYIERARAKEARKMDIFKVLMANRATPLNIRAVEAMNIISIEFYGDRNVINAWKEFIEIRCKQETPNPNINQEYTDSLVKLLQEMAVALGLNFYDDEIRRGCYRPNLHIAFENLQMEAQINLAKAITNGRLHIVIDSPTDNQIAEEKT